MSIGISAVAWISNGKAVARTAEGVAEYSLAELRGANPQVKLFSYSVDNFGRFPEYAKNACEVAALALGAARIDYARGKKMNMALLCAGYDNTTAANCDFFQDYLDCGRALGRGGLFVYTLPTSAVSEISIHFGMTGVNLYLESPESPFAELAAASRRMVESGEAEAAMLLWQDRDHTLCAIVSDRDPDSLIDVWINEADSELSAWGSPACAIEYLNRRTASGRISTDKGPTS